MVGRFETSIDLFTFRVVFSKSKSKMSIHERKLCLLEVLNFESCKAIICVLYLLSHIEWRNKFSFSGLYKRVFSETFEMCTSQENWTLRDFNLFGFSCFVLY